MVSVIEPTWDAFLDMAVRHSASHHLAGCLALNAGGTAYRPLNLQSDQELDLSYEV